MICTVRDQRLLVRKFGSELRKGETEIMKHKIGDQVVGSTKRMLETMPAWGK